MRPSFLNIVVTLQKPDFQILKWPLQDSDILSRTLGAGLDKSRNLYVDLQNVYKKRHVKSFRERNNYHRSRKTKSDAKNGAETGGTTQYNISEIQNSGNPDYIN